MKKHARNLSYVAISLLVVSGLGWIAPAIADEKIRIVNYRAPSGFSGEASNGSEESCSEGCFGLIDIDVLRTNLSNAIEPIMRAIPTVSTEGVELELNEMEISLEVDVSGGVALIGRIETGAAGGVKLKFVKRN